ncbi:MAG: TetR/AcrR family transcriptional regulator [Candidatus Zixiibacteriota bacterium]|nr:MAG: TetR/AcrR family transcriptional regulator [candidate division Zixibacteria bacterium]
MDDSTKLSDANRSGSVGARDKIVRAAIREFSENGLAGARVDQIALEAGVNKAMIYYHFSSKKNLYYQIIKELLAGRLADLQRSLEEQQSLEAALKQTLDLHAGLFVERPEIIKILLRELADPGSEVVATIAGIIQQSGLPAQLSKRLTDGVGRGEYRPVNVRQTIISFVTMSIGYYLLSPMFDKVWRTVHQPTFIDERKTAIVDLFMNGVRAR